MKHLLLICVMLCAELLSAQSVQPSVFNADGGSGTIKSATDTIEIFYNIGEPIYEDKLAGSSIRMTQGFLQPDIVLAGQAMSVNMYTTAITCKDAANASIVVNVNGLHTPFHYAWYKNGTPLSDTVSAITGLGPGIYSFVVTDSWGNSKSDTVSFLNSDEACFIAVHNGFTPNGDGINDGFVIDHLDMFPDNKVSIFSRWGNIIWEEKGYNNTTVVWKGQGKSGQMLPAGTYFYVVEADGKTMKGWVELLR